MNLRRHTPTYITAWAAGLLALALAFLSMAANPAHSFDGRADHGFFVAAGAGASDISDVETDLQTETFDVQWLASAEVGYKFRSGFGLSILGDYGRNGGDGWFGIFGREATLGTVTITPCATYTHNFGITVHPYIGACAGLGYIGLDPKDYDAFPNEEADNFNSADLGVAWKLRAGAAFDISRDGRWQATGEFQYGCTELASFTGAGPDHTSALCRKSGVISARRYF
jgi:hypothetical protein